MDRTLYNASGCKDKMMRFVLHQNRRHRFSDLTGHGETTRQICS